MLFFKAPKSDVRVCERGDDILSSVNVDTPKRKIQLFPLTRPITFIRGAERK